MSDLLAGSADTWRDRALTRRCCRPRSTRRPRTPTCARRVDGLRRRHTVRRERAEQVYADSRSPERGWPVADDRAVLRFAADLVRSRRRWFVAMVLLNAAAAVAALAVPKLLGVLVDRVTGTGAAEGIGTLALVIVAVVLAQSLFTFAGQITSTLFGQDLLASAREYVVGTILRLPLSRVEGASTGDLVTRVTRDVGTMSRAVQYGVPMAVITLLTVVLSVGAMLLNSVLLAAPALLIISSSWVQVRRYLRRAPKAYIAEGASYSRINSTLTETVEGARTVEALGLAERRIRATEDDVALSAQAERYSLTLRNLLFTVIDVAFNAPRVVTVLVGAWGYWNGWATLGQITTAVLYVEALSGPLDRLVGEVDRLQVGAASTAGCSASPPCRRTGTPAPTCPAGPDLVGEDLRFAYRPGHDVLHGVDLDPAHRGAAGGRRAQRLGQVHARPAAGRHQRPAHRVGPGRRGRPGRRCRWRRCAPRSPWSPRSTTSSSARCATTSCSAARTRATTRSGAPWPRSAPRSGCAASRTTSTRWSARATWRSPRRRPSRSRWPGWSSPTRTRWSSTRPPR